MYVSLSYGLLKFVVIKRVFKLPPLIIKKQLSPRNFPHILNETGPSSNPENLPSFKIKAMKNARQILNLPRQQHENKSDANAPVNLSGKQLDYELSIGNRHVGTCKVDSLLFCK